MPYVDRDTNDRIVAGYDKPQWKKQEWVAEDSPEWQAYRVDGAGERAQRIREELIRADRHLSRAMEDLIEILEANKVVDEKVLPQPLIQRLAFKERLREQLRAELAALEDK